MNQVFSQKTRNIGNLVLTFIPKYLHRNIKSSICKTLTVLLLFSLIVGCKDENNDSNNKKIIIKGVITAASVKKSSRFKSKSNSYTLADAKKILVFNSSGSYDIFNITDSTFTAKAMQGTAVAIAFLAADNTFIGSLQSGGLNVIPLVSLKDGDKTVIDFSRLYLDGTNVIPANNPIGTQISLSASEIERYRQFGSFFKSLAQNMDADGDGKADILDNKGLYVSTIYDVYCGTLGINTSSQIDTSRIYVNYTLRVCGGKSIIPTKQQLTLSGPKDSPYSNIFQSYFTTGPDCFISFFRRETQAPAGYPFGSAFLPFGDGTYNLSLDNKDYTLQYSKVDAKYFFVLATPTVHTNSNNEITSITIEYKDMAGAKVNPDNFVYQTMVQLNNANYTQLEQIGTLWENPEAKTNTELYNFTPKKTIKTSDLYTINVCYLDLVGNSYTMVFYK